MSVKISSLEIENVKRVKAVQITPAENGLMIIGGKNNQRHTIGQIADQKKNNLRFLTCDLALMMILPRWLI